MVFILTMYLRQTVDRNVLVIKSATISAYKTKGINIRQHQLSGG